MKTKTTYIADDGTEFNDKALCEAHDKGLSITPAVEACMAERINPGPYRTGVIQHILAWEAQREGFLAKKAEECKAHTAARDKAALESRAAAKQEPKKETAKAA